MGKLNFSSPLASTGLRLGYELQYYSERQTLDGAQLSGYWLSNLNLVAMKWAKGLEVALGFYNLFNKNYEQPGARINWQDAFMQEGRNMRLKVDYHF
jgi:iron complex outermembrane receptor protein